ncbi:MAG: hypothetical protein AcusKO_23140 [Acuticoccus sp.]
MRCAGWFAFIPARYTGEWSVLPGGLGADIWTFVTYALLHGSTMHIIITNAVWMLAFGSAVARRFGTARFLLFSALAAAGGAAVHLAFHPGEAVPVVGASAAIAGQMAGAARFVFDPNGPLVFRSTSDTFYRRRRRASSARSPTRRRWSSSSSSLSSIWASASARHVGEVMPIAWEAHIGGFLTGLFTFRLFDSVRR